MRNCIPSSRKQADPALRDRATAIIAGGDLTTLSLSHF
jgi:hypothetical protein